MKSLLIAASALTIGGAALAYDRTGEPTVPVDASQMEQDRTDTQTRMEYDRPPVAAERDLTEDAYAATSEREDWSGMGGPYEEVYASGAIDMSPRAAGANYPACQPGPGDDNCIQLYERGVRTALASWSGETGGYLGATDTRTAMGGHLEEVDHDARYAAHDDEQYEGVGGPFESADGYPPCERGPGDDNCIQLYERGVTGEGN